MIKEDKYQRFNRMTHRASIHLFCRQRKMDMKHEKTLVKIKMREI